MFAVSWVAFPIHTSVPVGLSLQEVISSLRSNTESLKFSDPVTHVYAPLDYASAAVDDYVDRYARIGIENLFLGMNPGPWGMAQTGIPFGEVAHVRDFLGINKPVGRPSHEHPKRLVTGFECCRSEVSGRRFWEWVSERFLTPEAFFDRFFVWNWCPLAFLEDTGRNRTPDKLSIEERKPLEEACDEALRGVVEVLRPTRVIGIGAYACKRARIALKDDSLSIESVLHPSPASPAANRGWAPQVEVQLKALGIKLPARK